MNKFELFTMIFYAIDLYYDDNPLDLLGQFLSSMSPFTFEDVGSAVPYVYREFCDSVKKEITIENSYDIAVEYLKAVKFFDLDLVSIFKKMDVEKWKEGCKKYLATDHKGKNMLDEKSILQMLE